MSTPCFDLIVIGAGIVGASCAAAAADAGLRVAIVEPGPIGGGVTAAGMGHLVAMVGNPAELALAQYSLGFWDNWADRPEAEFGRCGTLWVARGETDAASLATQVQRLRDAGISAETVDATGLYQLEPELAPGLYGGMLVPHDAVVYAPRVTRALVQDAQARGAQLFSGRSAKKLAPRQVILDDGSRLSGPVLVATGNALAELLPQLPLRQRKGHLLITDRYPGWLRHQVLEMGYADSAHGDADSSVAFNVQPRPTGQLLIGSSREFSATDSAVSPTMLRRMLERAFDYMPGLRDLQALRSWTGFRPCTPDGLPYLGAVPELPDVWVAAGHEGLGVTTAPGSALLLLDLILQRTPAIDPTPYAPSRVAA